MPDDAELLSVLESLRERGAIGELSLPDAVAHAASFVAAIPPEAERLLDLGSGGGLPGLVIAVRRPDLALVLTERRERRADLLRLAVSRLGIGDRVGEMTGDVRTLGRSTELMSSFDVVTARAFGEPLWTLSCAVPFLGQHGLVIVSEPPASAAVGADERRWPRGELERLGFVLDPIPFPHVQRLQHR